MKWLTTRTGASFALFEAMRSKMKSNSIRLAQSLAVVYLAIFATSSFATEFSPVLGGNLLQGFTCENLSDGSLQAQFSDITKAMSACQAAESQGHRLYVSYSVDHVSSTAGGMSKIAAQTQARSACLLDVIAAGLSDSNCQETAVLTEAFFVQSVIPGLLRDEISLAIFSSSVK
jgi:hypothetical protein